MKTVEYLGTFRVRATGEVVVAVQVTDDGAMVRVRHTKGSSRRFLYSANELEEVSPPEITQGTIVDQLQSCANDFPFLRPLLLRARTEIETLRSDLATLESAVDFSLTDV